LLKIRILFVVFAEILEKDLDVWRFPEIDILDLFGVFLVRFNENFKELCKAMVRQISNFLGKFPFNLLRVINSMSKNFKHVKDQDITLTHLTVGT
jgi:hypothetical protein